MLTESLKLAAEGTCPRCSAHSLLRSHDTIACLSCGHVVEEPAREAWDATSAVPGAGPRKSPAWTKDERSLWQSGGSDVPDTGLRAESDE